MFPSSPATDPAPSILPVPVPPAFMYFLCFCFSYVSIALVPFLSLLPSLLVHQFFLHPIFLFLLHCPWGSLPPFYSTPDSSPSFSSTPVLTMSMLFSLFVSCFFIHSLFVPFSCSLTCFSLFCIPSFCSSYLHCFCYFPPASTTPAPRPSLLISLFPTPSFNLPIFFFPCCSIRHVLLEVCPSPSFQPLTAAPLPHDPGLIVLYQIKNLIS